MPVWLFWRKALYPCRDSNPPTVHPTALSLYWIRHTGRCMGLIRVRGLHSRDLRKFTQSFQTNVLSQIRPRQFPPISFPIHYFIVLFNDAFIYWAYIRSVTDTSEYGVWVEKHVPVPVYPPLISHELGLGLNLDFGEATPPTNRPAHPWALQFVIHYLTYYSTLHNTT
jgi:hypothetical protein